VIRTVVKHSYLKGSKGVGKARAHINYIQYRPGEDREKGARVFFNGDRDDVLGREVKERLSEQERNGVTMHKLILSPGVQGCDLRDYTRELMEELQREKGQQLDWFAVEHRNTEHAHLHVVVMGKDLNGGRVRLDLHDMKNLREFGDRYLEREHKLDRYLDREIERLLKEPHRGIELDFKRTKGDREFERLIYGDVDESDRRRGSKENERDRQEWERMDKDLHRSYGDERFTGRPRTYKQYQMESSGRWDKFHQDYQNRLARERWLDMGKDNPKMIEEIAKELFWLQELEKEQRMDRYKDVDIDRLINGKDKHERWIDRILDKEDLLSELDVMNSAKAGERGGDDRTTNAMGVFTHNEPLDRERGQEIDLTGFADSRQSFDNAPEIQHQRQREDRDERERDERRREDDPFGR
jgi:type IV secretory pathway VirD2 relaxase